MSQKAKLAQRVVLASRAARVAKASRLGIIASAVLTFLIFAISYYGQLVGNFTFTVDRMAQNAGITLYESELSREFTSRLIAGRVESADGMTALCGTEYSSFELGHNVCVPGDSYLTSIDGSNNGESLMVYTFYLENAGDLMVDMTAQVNVVSATKGAEEAIRVRVIFDNVGLTFAKLQTDSGRRPGEPEIGTEPFTSPTTVMIKNYTALQPGAVLKITVVIWFEGEDADHNLNIVGGGVKFDMQFSVTHVYEEF
ncbi:MAG: hypothetical protein V1761_02805 [bacterium]